MFPMYSYLLCDRPIHTKDCRIIAIKIKIRRTKLCVLISIAVPSYLTQSANYSDSDVNMFYAICIITKKAVTLEKSRITAFFPVKLATGIGPVTTLYRLSHASNSVGTNPDL